MVDWARRTTRASRSCIRAGKFMDEGERREMSFGHAGRCRGRRGFGDQKIRAAPRAAGSVWSRDDEIPRPQSGRRVERTV